MDAKSHQVGHRERLRARFRKGGIDAVHDYELLELILFRAVPWRDVESTAKELIKKFGSLANVWLKVQVLICNSKAFLHSAGAKPAGTTVNDFT